MRTVLTIMTTTRDSIAALTAEVRALREEVGWLRSQVGTRMGTEPGPVVQPQTTRPLAEPYSQDPRHDPAYVEAAMRGDLPAMRTALAAAKQRISAEITTPRGRQPASVAELDLLDARQSGGASHQQRRAQAQDMLSLAHVDSRGGRHGAASRRHPGHRAARGQADLPVRASRRERRAETLLGMRVGSVGPRAGEEWIPPDESLAAGRRRVEGSYG